MLNRRAMTAVFSLALAGSLALPGFAAGSASVEVPLVWQPLVVSEAAAGGSKEQVVISGQEALTRGELVSALHSKEGKPVVNYAMDYTDVDGESRYGEAIRWASSEGIVSGYDDGRFGPDDPVTREQMAVILYRDAQNHDLGFTGMWAFPLPYSDAAEISDFAYEAVCWMTMKGIMEGAEEDTFAPRGTVSCQEAASILEQYLQVTEQTEIANPFLPCETMEQAGEIAGFSMVLPSMLSSQAERMSIYAVASGMIEVVYQGEEGQMILRKALGTGDVSGDYTAYAWERVEEIQGRTVTLKGEGDQVMVAVWCDGAYTFAVRIPSGVDGDVISHMAAEIR